MDVINLFPWTIIEVPKKSFYSQSKISMRVASKEQGGAAYPGPEIVCLERWKHTKAFYILDPVEVGMYLATSLHDRFHYQVKKSDEWILDKITSFCTNSKGKCKFHRVQAGENHHDKNILVIHKPSSELCNLLSNFDDCLLINELIGTSKFDNLRANSFIDTGFTSGKS